MGGGADPTLDTDATAAATSAAAAGAAAAAAGDGFVDAPLPLVMPNEHADPHSVADAHGFVPDAHALAADPWHRSMVSATNALLTKWLSAQPPHPLCAGPTGFGAWADVVVRVCAWYNASPQKRVDWLQLMHLREAERIALTAADEYDRAVAPIAAAPDGDANACDSEQKFIARAEAIAARTRADTEQRCRAGGCNERAIEETVGVYLPQVLAQRFATHRGVWVDAQRTAAAQRMREAEEALRRAGEDAKRNAAAQSELQAKIDELQTRADRHSSDVKALDAKCRDELKQAVASEERIRKHTEALLKAAEEMKTRVAAAEAAARSAEHAARNVPKPKGGCVLM